MRSRLSSAYNRVKKFYDDHYTGAGTAKTTSSSGSSNYIGTSLALRGEKLSGRTFSPLFRWGIGMVFAIGTGVTTYFNRCRNIKRREKRNKSPIEASLSKPSNKPILNGQVIRETDIKNDDGKGTGFVLLADNFVQLDSKESRDNKFEDAKEDGCCASYWHYPNPEELSRCSSIGFKYLSLSTFIYMGVGAFNSWLQLSYLLNHTEQCEDEINAWTAIQFILFNMGAMYIARAQIFSQLYYGIPLQIEYYKKFFVDGGYKNIKFLTWAKAIGITSIASLGGWFANPDFIASLNTNTWFCRLPINSMLSPYSNKFIYAGYALAGIGCLFNFTINALLSVGAFDNVGSGSTKRKIEECLVRLPHMRKVQKTMYGFYGIDALGNLILTTLSFTDLPKDDSFIMNPRWNNKAGWMLAGGLALGFVNFLNVLSIDIEGFRKELEAMVGDLDTAERLSRAQLLASDSKASLPALLPPSASSSSLASAVPATPTSTSHITQSSTPHNSGSGKDSDDKQSFIPIPMTTDEKGNPIPRLTIIDESTSTLGDVKHSGSPSSNNGSDVTAPLLGAGAKATSSVDSFVVGMRHSMFEERNLIGRQAEPTPYIPIPPEDSKPHSSTIIDIPTGLTGGTNLPPSPNNKPRREEAALAGKQIPIAEPRSICLVM